MPNKIRNLGKTGNTFTNYTPLLTSLRVSTANSFFLHLRRLSNFGKVCQSLRPSLPIIPFVAMSATQDNSVEYSQGGKQSGEGLTAARTVFFS
jgi:hypothetical protein